MGQLRKLVKEVFERGHARGGGEAGIAKRMEEHKQKAEAEAKRRKIAWQRKRREEQLARKLGFPAEPPKDEQPGGSPKTVVYLEATSHGISISTQRFTRRVACRREAPADIEFAFDDFCHVHVWWVTNDCCIFRSYFPRDQHFHPALHSASCLPPGGTG